MENSLGYHLHRICEILQKNKVKYLIVGGTAVFIYGHYRFSLGTDGKPLEKPDLDFWFKPDYTNYLNLLNAIEELGRDVAEHRKTLGDPKKSFFNLDFPEFHLDFLPEILGLSDFSTSYKNRNTINLYKLDIAVISFEDLILSKKATSRAKDIEDIGQLIAKRKEK